MKDAIQPGSQALVIQAWQTTFPDPLTLEAGETVQTGKRDSEWPGWIWCANAAGKSGWAPESYLDEINEHEQTARAKRNYNAVELEVKPGDHLAVEMAESGWCWATHENGQSGWVPLACLEIADQAP